MFILYMGALLLVHFFFIMLFYSFIIVFLGYHGGVERKVGNNI